MFACQNYKNNNNNEDKSPLSLNCFVETKLKIMKIGNKWTNALFKKKKKIEIILETKLFSLELFFIEKYNKTKTISTNLMLIIMLIMMVLMIEMCIEEREKFCLSSSFLILKKVG